MRGRIEFPDASGVRWHRLRSQAPAAGDVDGDGLADLVYVESGRVTIWLNQSGNGWSDPIVVHGTPPISDDRRGSLADMLGNGTAGILWTYDFRHLRRQHLQVLGPHRRDQALSAQRAEQPRRRPHAGRIHAVDALLSRRSSRHETRWRTRLPFPVQVVARVEVIDEISGGKLTTEYRYHQGYWDGDEREFRGFGMVEQLDTETFARYHAEGLHGPQGFNGVDAVHFSPPTLTRTWFHQGQVQDSSGYVERTGSLFHLLAGRSAAVRTRAAQGTGWHRHDRRAQRRTEPAAPRAARAARLGAAQRAVRARRLTQSRPPVHRHGGAVRRAGGRALRAWHRRPAAALLSVPDREPHHPVGAGHRPDDAARLHRRSRRVRHAAPTARHCRAPRTRSRAARQRA